MWGQKKNDQGVMLFHFKLCTSSVQSQNHEGLPTKPGALRLDY